MLGFSPLYLLLGKALRLTTLRTRTSVFTFIILIVVSAFILENQFRDFCLENQWAADLGARLNLGSWFCCSITKFAILSIDEVEKEIENKNQSLLSF